MTMGGGAMPHPNALHICVHHIDPALFIRSGLEQDVSPGVILPVYVPRHAWLYTRDDMTSYKSLAVIHFKLLKISHAFDFEQRRCDDVGACLQWRSIVATI